MIKRIFLCLMLFSCLFINVYAETIKEDSAVVKVGDVETPVYEVEVTWGKMEFVYTEQINYVWDEDKHIYTHTSINISHILKGMVSIKSKLTFYHTDIEEDILKGLYLLGYRYLIKPYKNNIFISKWEPYPTQGNSYHACVENISNINMINEEELFGHMKKGIIYEIKTILTEAGVL